MTVVTSPEQSSDDEEFYAAVTVVGSHLSMH